MFRKRKEIAGHGAAVYCCAARGNHIYSGSADKFLARWLVDEGIQDKFAIRFEQPVYALELLEEAFILVGLANGDFHVFDAAERKEVKYFTQHRTGIFAIRYNPEKEHIYVADAEGNLSVWNRQFELLVYLPLDCGKIRRIAVSEDGGHFALACQDGTLRVFETGFFNEVHTIRAHENGTTAVLFHPLNPSLLVSGGKDALLKVWNWHTEECLVNVAAHTFAIYDVVAVNQGEQLLTASRDKNVKVWNSRNLDFLKRLDSKEGGHRHSVNALAVLSDREVVSCSDDKRLIIWTTEE